MTLRKPVLAVLAAALISAGTARAEELFLYNWSNYIPPELLEKFEQETGIKVTLDVFDSNETLLAKLQAGAAGYDVIVPSDYMVQIMIDEELLEKIDAASMENFSRVGPPHDATPFDPERAYSAPYMWGTTGLTYDSERTDGPLEESWKPFFEPPEALRGQIAALNDEVEMWNAAAYYLGYDKCTEDAEEARAILELMEGQKPYLAMYQSDGTIDRMIAKEVIMHQQWNGASHRTRERLPSAVYIYPKEGLSFWADNFAIPKGAPNLENARTFVNWMMAPENAAAASNFTGYMNAIQGSDEYLDESIKNDPAVNMPVEYSERLRPAKPCSVKSRELRDRVWTRLKS